ncbi:Kallmann syndrome 1 sequence [Cichlidogyrus casuarinus]|uniref:Kallmann syndrome 1 sequence n=1 Tax=Cichlidogyrus casuarinus TaxID=1844966 RepID=A0ABD2QGF3_9PLAT
MQYESSAILNKDIIIPGHLYRVRVAAVNAYGSSGFGVPSKVYPLVPSMPRVPNTPRLRNPKSMRYEADQNTVEVTVSWDEVPASDLPVDFLNLTWVQDLGYIQADGTPLESLVVHSKILPPTAREYTIQNLAQSASYKLQLRTVSIWHGHGQLVSKPHTSYIKTQNVYPSKVFNHAAANRSACPSNYPLTSTLTRPKVSCLSSDRSPHKIDSLFTTDTMLLIREENVFLLLLLLQEVR